MVENGALLRYLAKKNTFHDFVDCAKHLKDAGLSSQMSCEGRSAGGLLVGNAVNLAPDSFVACIAGVPFVDLMTTMCDPSIPLTTEEWEEWGNPNEAKYHQYMLEYSPIDNISPVTYPKMLLVSGLNDPRVAYVRRRLRCASATAPTRRRRRYWEPAKWAQVLRHTVANPDDVYVKMDMSAGLVDSAEVSRRRRVAATRRCGRRTGDRVGSPPRIRTWTIQLVTRSDPAQATSPRRTGTATSASSRSTSLTRAFAASVAARSLRSCASASSAAA